MAESVLRITIDSRQALINAQAVNKELQSIDKTGDFASKSMDSLSVATRTLAGHMAGLVTVGAAVSKMDAYTGLQNRLKLVTNSQVELSKAMNDTFAIAQKTRQSWESAAQVYQGFANNAKTLGLTMAQTAQLTETVSKAVAISGGSAASSEAALIQFNQALGAGALRGEELNSVMEQTPGLAKAIAEGMGLTVGQLRTVAAQGKITSEELVKALTKAKSSVDDLFSKTDITIGQSLTLLNNELSKFVGEAGQSSGAAKTLAEGIQTLSQNLAPLADGAMVLGIGYLTKSMLEKAAATRSAIVASAQSQAAIIAEKTATVELAGVEALRARQNASLAAQELRTAQLALVNAKNKDAQALATQRLAVAEVAYAASVKESKILTEQYTLAQDALNRAQSLGSKLLTLVGGPIGALTLAAMGLGAGYMYMQKRADEANKKLEEQAAVAKKAKDELLALKGLEKDDAVDKMTAAFKLQNEALAESSSKINMQLNAIEQLYKGNKDVVKVVQDARNGTISMNDAISKFNELRISKEVYNSIKQNTEEFVKNATEATNSKAKLSLFGIEVELSGRKAQTAKAGVDQNTESLVDNAKAARDAAKAHQDFFDSLNKDVKNANQEYAMLGFGYSKEVIDKINELQEAKQKVAPKGTTAIVTQEEINQILQAQKALDAVKDREDAITQAKRDQTEEAKKQLKLAEKQAVLLAGNNEQTRNMLRVYQAFRNAGLGDKQARVMTAQVGRENDFQNSKMFGSHTDFNNGYSNSGFLSWQKTRATSLMQYLQGQGSLDKNGNIKQTQGSLDAMAMFYVQEVMNGKGYGPSKKALQNDNLDYRSLEKTIGQNSIGWDYNGTGKLGKSNAAKHLAKQDNYFNQLSQILGKNPENALSSIGELSKFEDEAYKAREKTLEEIKQLQSKYDTEAIQRSKARDEEINKATILGQAQLIPKIKERYDAQDKLAELQIDQELNSWKWGESQKIEYAYQTNLLRLDAEGKFNDERKDLAKKAYDELYAYDLKKFKETQLLKQLEYSMQYTDRVSTARDRIARYSLNPFDYQRTALVNQQADAYAKNNKSYSDDLKAADEALRKGEIDQEQHYQRMLDAKRLYTDNDLAISLEHKRKEEDLVKSQQQNQLQIWSGLVSSSQTMWSQMTQSVKDASGEQSASYKTMFAMQQAFSIASTLIATHLAAMQVTADGANPTLFGKVSAHAAILAMGYAQAGLIASQAIAGFATGGHITGKGTGTSDDIPIMASNGEFMMRYAAVQKLGLPMMEYINKTGELPFQREYEALKMQFSMPNKKDTSAFRDGGLVGVSRMSNAEVERRQFDSIRQGNSVASQPKVTIINQTSQPVEATSQWDGSELQVILKEMQKQNEAMMDQKIGKSWKAATSQGGVIDNLKRGR